MSYLNPFKRDVNGVLLVSRNTKIRARVWIEDLRRAMVRRNLDLNSRYKDEAIKRQNLELSLIGINRDKDKTKEGE